MHSASGMCVVGGALVTYSRPSLDDINIYCSGDTSNIMLSTCLIQSYRSNSVRYICSSRSPGTYANYLFSERNIVDVVFNSMTR